VQLDLVKTALEANILVNVHKARAQWSKASSIKNHHKSDLQRTTADRLIHIMGKVAFITGANGITGSAILKYLVEHTSAEEWSDLIVTSRSPFQTIVSDPRIEFVALDFSQDAKTLAGKMATVCSKVTHAYFSSYVHKDDFKELNVANEKLFTNFLDALIETAPNLENVTLQTGGKHYNVHLFPVPSPAQESDRRLESPIGNFYYPQEDHLIARQKGQRWTWNVIRPEAIIGATQKPNGMNEALTLALYLLVCRELGEEAVMPTNQRYWEGAEDISDTRLISEMTIWASTSSKTGNQAFNITNGDYFCWKYMWPRLAKYFGASASSKQTFSKPYPKEGDLQLEVSLDEWSKDKRQIWDKLCDRAGVPEAKASWDAATWAFQDWVFQRTWSATLSMSKARSFGWTGYVDSFQSFKDAFDEFATRRQIPPLSH
jgi:nucleoside-diphosphate-sugar epimerase